MAGPSSSKSMAVHGNTSIQDGILAPHPHSQDTICRALEYSPRTIVPVAPDLGHLRAR